MGAFRGTRLVGVLVAIALGVATFFVVRALTDDDDGGGTLRSQSDGAGALTLHYPVGWNPDSEAELARLPGSPVAAVRRADRQGIVIVNRQEGATGNFEKVSRQFDRRLKKRISDFRKVSAHPVSIQAGQAFLYSYIRKRRGTVHTIVVVPAGSVTYTLNAVVPAGANDAARQVGAMIRSFDA
jgi:hypothetical protein